MIDDSRSHWAPLSNENEENSKTAEVEAVRIRISIPFMCQTRCHNFSERQKNPKKVNFALSDVFCLD